MTTIATLYPIIDEWKSTNSSPKHNNRVVIKKEFEPIFKKNDSLNFKILIIRFEDYIADKETYCIGRSIEENLIVSQANDTTLTNLKVEHVTDSIPPPRNSQEAIDIKNRHNADLIIYGLAKNKIEDCKGADVCFRYNVSNEITAKAKPAIDIKEEKFDSEYIPTTPTKIELGQFSIEYMSLSKWVSSLSKLKLGDKNQAIFELDQIAMDTSLTKTERSKRFFEIGKTFYSMNEYKKSMSAYNKSIELNPKNFKATHNRAVINWLEDKLDKAKEDLEICLANPYSESHLTFNLRGIIYNEEKEYKKALEYYDLAIKNDSTFSEFYINKGDSYLQLNEPKNSISAYEQALKISDVDSSKTYSKIAIAFQQQKLFKKAIELHNKAIKINPDNNDLYIGRASTKIAFKLYDSAINDLDKAIEINSEDPSSYYYCGLIFGEHLNDFEQAIIEYDKVLNFYKNDRQFVYHRGKTLFALGKKLQLITELGEMVNAYPNNGDINTVLGYGFLSSYIAVKGDYELSSVFMNSLYKLEPTNMSIISKKVHLHLRMCDFMLAYNTLKGMTKEQDESDLGWSINNWYNRVVEEENFVNEQLKLHTKD